MISGTIIPTPLPGQRASGPIGRGGRLLYLTLGLSYIASYYFYEPILLIGLAGLTTALFRPIRLTDLAFAFLVIDIRAEGIESAINYSLVSTILFNLLFLKVLASSRLALGRPIVIALALLSLHWLAAFLINFNEASLFNALQDMRIVVVGVVAVLLVGGPKLLESDLENLNWFFGGVLFAFIVLILVTPGNKFYISMDSIKALVILPSLYAIMTNRLNAGLVLATITIFVLTYFSSRYLFVTYLGALGILIVYKAPAKAAVGVAVTVFVAAAVGQDSLEFNRMLTMLDFFRTPDENYYGPFFSRVASIDRIRAMEGYYVFADASPPQLLFGRGFGAQIRDTLGFVNYDLADGAAFSVREIQTRVFGNLHDPLIEWQLRFGAVFLIGFAVFAGKSVIHGLRRSNILSYALPFIALNCYWSGKGIFVILVILVFAAQEWRRIPRMSSSRDV